MFLPVKRYTVNDFTINVVVVGFFSSPEKKIKGHMVPYRSSLIYEKASHGIIRENSGAVGHPHQLLKPHCFHSIVNKDVW